MDVAVALGRHRLRNVICMLPHGGAPLNLSLRGDFSDLVGRAPERSGSTT